VAVARPELDGLVAEHQDLKTELNGIRDLKTELNEIRDLTTEN